MNAFKLLIIFLLVFGLQVGIYSQVKRFPGNYSIVVVKKKGKNPREVVDIQKLNADTIYYAPFQSEVVKAQHLESIKRIYFNHNIRIFSKSKFHYKTGFLLNTSFGLGYDHSNFHLSLNKRFNFLECGIGFGQFSNFYLLPIDFSAINISSSSLYINSKYILNRGQRSWYGRAKLGYNFNYSNFNIDEIKNGFLFEPSIGLCFSSKRRFKHYVEISQHLSNASGSFTIPSVNSTIPTTGSFNILFNRTVFTYGIEIGKSGKKRKSQQMLP